MGAGWRRDCLAGLLERLSGEEDAPFWLLRRAAGHAAGVPGSEIGVTFAKKGPL